MSAGPSEVISLLTSDEDEDESAPLSQRVAQRANAAVEPSPRRSSGATTQPKKRQRRGGRGWRRRAGDASPASSQAAADPGGELALQAASLEASLSATELRSALLAMGLRPGGRAKAGLALRLVRARRAAAASERLYRGEGGSTARYDAARGASLPRGSNRGRCDAGPAAHA